VNLGRIASSPGERESRVSWARVEKVDIVRRVVEDGFNQGKLDVGAACAPDFVNNVCVYGVPMGARGLTDHIRLVRKAYADLFISVEDAIADSSHVCIRWESRGTARGAYMGLDGTGRPFRTSQIAFYTFRGESLVDWSGNYDGLSIVRAVAAGDDDLAELSEAPRDPWSAAADTSRTTDEKRNRELARALVAQWLGGDPEGSALPPAITSESGLRINGHKVAAGPDAFLGRRSELRQGFGSFGAKLSELIVQRDKVALRWALRGVHVGDILGVRATGRPVRLVSSAVLTFKDGGLVEWREIFDDMGFVNQTQTMYVLTGEERRENSEGT
jgi:predicted ester cyclase